MKRLLSIAFLFMLTVAIYAQQEVTKFMGIPVDGTKSSMILKLRGKGFVYDSAADCLTGEFNGAPVYVYVITYNSKVYRIAVADREAADEGQVRAKYNSLCRQFDENQKYVPVSSGVLSNGENISHEMRARNRQYQAVYAQLPADDDLEKRLVWFTISNADGGRYRLMICYDNEFNHSTADDL